MVDVHGTSPLKPTRGSGYGRPDLAAGLRPGALTLLNFFEEGAEDVTDLLPEITAPTLVAHGRDDRLVSFEAAHPTASLLPIAQHAKTVVRGTPDLAADARPQQLGELFQDRLQTSPR